MATKEGNKKIKESLIKRLGGVAAYKTYMAEIGAKGGKATVPKGFAKSKVKNRG